MAKLFCYLLASMAKLFCYPWLIVQELFLVVLLKYNRALLYVLFLWWAGKECYCYKYNRAIISITELHYMLVPWRVGKDWELFLEVTLSQCLRWVIPECFILLGDSKAGLQIAHASVHRDWWVIIFEHKAWH